MQGCFLRRSDMKAMKSALLGIALCAAASAAQAQNEQFIPVLSYRVGPYAAGGSGYYGGAIDYWTLVNMTGGINGVKLLWEECETEYNASKGVECYERLKKKNGGASTVEPLATGIAYGLFDRVAQDKIPMTTFGYGLASSAEGRVYDWVFPLGTTYWDQMAAMIAYLGQKEGGLDKLKGKMLGVWWAASEEDIIPAGDAAKGYVSASFTASGTNFPVMQDIKTKVYGAKKGNLEDPARLGNVMYTR